MDFDLTDEQSLLKDSVERLFADTYSFEERRKHMASPEGWSTAMWGRYAEMGLLALPFAEDDGGIGGGAVETMIVMEAIGRALALEPYFPTVILGGGFLRLGGDEALKAELVPGVADGSVKLALAQVEKHSRYDLHHVETSARKDGEGWILNGAKGVVIGGDSADHLFVTARTSGNPREERGIGVFVIDARREGVTRRGYAMQDGQRAAETTFENAAARAVGDPENGLPLVRRVVDQAIAALAAESVGVMSALQALTTDYLKVRKQFGVAIGQFQALQHKAVDMFVAAEQARSITLYATMMADSDEGEARARAMHAAKAEIGRGGRLVGENAVQLHGGVGMTAEYAVGHYLKRMAMIDLTFGDADFNLEALAEKGGLFGEG